MNDSKAKWTVMVYLAADNSLSPNAINILQALERAEYHEKVHVLAGFDLDEPAPRGTRYVEINRHRKLPGKINWPLHNDLVTTGERNHEVVYPTRLPDDAPVAENLYLETDSQGGLQRFLTWATANYPAERYMLILFGHGTVVAGNTFLQDSNPPSFMRMQDLQGVLGEFFGESKNAKTGQKLDLLGFHNCVMNAVETAHLLQDQAKLTLGSQGLVLVVGWPYDKIINSIVANVKAEATGEPVAARRYALDILTECARHMLDFSLMTRSSEQAVCDLEKLGEAGFITALQGLAAVLKEALNTDNATGHLLYPLVCDAILLARLKAQSYWDEVFVDLYDFCTLLAGKCDEWYKLLGAVAGSRGEMQLLQKMSQACAGVETQIKQIIVGSYYICPDLQYSRGLSIYFPWTEQQSPVSFEKVEEGPEENPRLVAWKIKTPFDEYQTYPFAAASGWGAFLDVYFQSTIRDMRPEEVTLAKSGSEALTFTAEEPRRLEITNLIKTTGDGSKEGDSCTCPQLKNYPRRNYMSKADALLVKQGRASYLGWNARGLIKQILGPESSDF